MVESNKNNEESKKVVEEVELHQINPKIENAHKSPFINQTKDWGDEELFKIPADLIKGITEELNFAKPSRIQAFAIPLILKLDEKGEYQHLIAQSKNGSGKTGAFVIGSLLRVDPKIQKPQIVVLCNTRELGNQIHQVYLKATTYCPDIKIQSLLDYKSGAINAQVIISTLGKIKSLLGNRGSTLDLSELRCFIVDEADFFFSDQKNKAELFEIHKNLQKTKKSKYQYILFSATYPEEVTQEISNLMTIANQIKLKTEQLRLDHIQQFEYRCDSKKKIDFIMDVFEACKMTQTFIFVNTKKFAEFTHFKLRDAGFKSTLIFSDMSNEERDEYVEKFRKEEVNVVLTTNLLARGIDIPQADLVINFDVPKYKDFKTQKYIPDAETYQHRIGRAGRFGRKGIAITIYDNDDDEKIFWEIAEDLKITDTIRKLENPKQLNDLLTNIGVDFE